MSANYVNIDLCYGREVMMTELYEKFNLHNLLNSYRTMKYVIGYVTDSFYTFYENEVEAHSYFPISSHKSLINSIIKSRILPHTRRNAQ